MRGRRAPSPGLLERQNGLLCPDANGGADAAAAGHRCWWRRVVAPSASMNPHVVRQIGVVSDNDLVRHEAAFNRSVLVAFGVVGALWIIGLAVFLFVYAQALALVAAAYVAAFTLVIASTRLRTVVALLAAWAVAVLSMGALVYASGALVGEALFLGGLVGTALFGLWVLPSYLLMLGIDPDRRTATRT